MLSLAGHTSNIGAVLDARAATGDSSWLNHGILDIASERELVCANFGRKIMRAIYVRHARVAEHVPGRSERHGAEHVPGRSERHGAFVCTRAYWV